MVKVKDIYNSLNRSVPFATQMEWDNSGLLIGDAEKEVNLIAVMLDATKENVEKAIHNNIDLIVCHHPVMFKGAKSLKNTDSVYSLVKNDVSLIAVHTPWDICEDGVNFCLASALGLREINPLPTKDGGDMVKTGIIPGGMSENNFLNIVKEKLNIPCIKYVSGNDFIRTVAVCGGAGADFIDEVAGKVDAYVTADVSYHEFLHAKELGLTLIDAGHYNTEEISMNSLAVKIAVEYPDLKVMKLKSKDPIMYK